MNQEELSKKVGLNVKRLRKEKGLTQQELAAKCDFEKANLSRIEAGRINPTTWTLWTISQALEIPLYRILDIDNELD